MKKIIIICSIASVLLASIIIVNLINKNSKIEISDGVTIKVYEEGTYNVKKIVNVDDKQKLKEMERIINRIKLMDSRKTPKLGILIQTEIIIDENIKLSINLNSDSQYCRYTNEELGISELVKTPRGLIEWLNEVI